MALDHMIKEHNLGATFHRSMCRNLKSHKRAVMAETLKDSVTGVIAIPSIIVFSGIPDAVLFNLI